MLDLTAQLRGGVDRAPVHAPLPSGLVLTERAVAALRTYLVENGLEGYAVFRQPDYDLHDLDHHLADLGAPAGWETQGLPPGVEPLVAVTFDEDERPLSWPSGCVHLPAWQAVILRWYWMTDTSEYGSIWLAAAPTVHQLAALRQEVARLRRRKAAAVWQIVHGGYRDGQRLPRDMAAVDDLVLSDGLRARVETDIMRFFSDEAAAMYRALRVPQRRGVLLHGPPGNGKTSLVRYLGARLPDVPFLLLRPDASFDSDDLEGVVKRWSDSAPAVLVIEDLNWLIEKVNVSTFLNLLDGVESPRTGGGLLLIATTNHPDKLDSAINNRPGRFDMVIEVPCPDEPTRLRFLQAKLPDAPVETLTTVARRADRLSFAHLQEILRLSGLLAVDGGRSVRTDEDLLRAAEIVAGGASDAREGFQKLEVPFGLQHLKGLKR